MESIRRLFWKHKHKPHNFRTVYIGNRLPNVNHIVIEKFPKNVLVTSKYTLLNFIPKNLLQQLKRAANLYFSLLIILELQVENLPTSYLSLLIPLLFVLSVTALKQGYEDWHRHMNDRKKNMLLTKVVRDGKLRKVMSKEIKVGDIVCVMENEEFPCDIIMLSSSEVDGSCRITTVNLNGETSLNHKECIQETRSLQTIDALDSFYGYIECVDPTSDLYSFQGRLSMYQENVLKIRALAPDNILLKGSALKNTDFVFGVAVYTGQQTKMALNSQKFVSKYSAIERSMNKGLIVFFLLLFFGVLCHTLGFYYEQQAHFANIWFLGEMYNFGISEIINISFSFLILYNFIIPISLYVSLEMVKFINSQLITWDNDLFDIEENKATICNTSDLNDDLGQIEYLLTDKTGTLTQNHMVLRKFTIATERYLKVENWFCTENMELVEVLTPTMEQFLICLLLCNTVQIKKTVKTMHDSVGEIVSENKELEFQASHSDERALVMACLQFGITLHLTHDRIYQITIKDNVYSFKKLLILDFDSIRRQMSVIVENTETEQVFVLSKGAETSMMKEYNLGHLDILLHHSKVYALDGLRTLFIGYKEISAFEFETFEEEYHHMKNKFHENKNELSSTYSKMEKGITLIGVTAVQDLLQEEVSETLSALKMAGIKTWVLSGDSFETALNISYACGLIHRENYVCELVNIKEQEKIFDILMNFKEAIEKDVRPAAFIIDGETLKFTLEKHYWLFQELSMKCYAGLGCRLSPIQKAELVKLIKNTPSRPVTAAIGDGANDVSMIQESDIGFGIMGKEGYQSVVASDYGFSKFKYIKKMILYHGYRNYTRLSVMVLYFFYKNVAFIIPQFLYTFNSIYSGQSLYHGIYISAFNMAVTAMPIMAFSILEQPYPECCPYVKPELYKKLQFNSYLSYKQFLKWISLGIWHAFVCFYGVLYFAEDTALIRSGQMTGMWEFSTLVFQCIIITVNLKLFIESSFWTFYFVFSVFVSIFGFLILNGVFSYVYWGARASELYWSHIVLMFHPSFWAVTIVVVVTALIPDLLIKTFETYRLNLKCKV